MGKYLEFNTKQEADVCLDAINIMARGHWVRQGYSVDGEGVIGYKNGVENRDGNRTSTWDVVQEVNNKFYLASLTGTPFEAGMQQLSAFRFKEIDNLPLAQTRSVQ